MLKDQAEHFTPKSRKAWRNWLAKNHQSKQAVWLVYYKSSTKVPSISWSEAVDEALCFGWIDSTKKTIDEQRYRQYFSKRKPKSNWSKINKEKVKTLIDQGLMEAEGYKSIEVAKENGSWTLLDEVEAVVVPSDLESELAQDKVAVEFFERLSKSVKKGLLYWVISAKREETRQKRILEIVESAANERLPTPFR